MTKPNHMPTKKPAKAPKTARDAKRFSLVSAAAQQEMYKAISRLKPAERGSERRGDRRDRGLRGPRERVIR